MDLNRLTPVTLITGAATGIGAACARMHARRSTGGLILIDRDEPGLAALADELDAKNIAPERVSTLAFDISDEAWWTRASAFLQEHYGRLDWAIVSAGASRAAEIKDGELLDWPQPGAHLDGAILTLSAVMPLMRRNAQGGAVVIAAAEKALTAASADRPGLLQLMRAAAREAAGANVRVNAVAPGGAETPMWQSLPWFADMMREAGSERAALDALARLALPLARYAQTDDIARLITMLLSDESAITGATLVVDGGYRL